MCVHGALGMKWRPRKKNPVVACGPRPVCWEPLVFQIEEWNCLNERSSEAISGIFRTYPSVKKRGDKRKSAYGNAPFFGEDSAHWRASSGSYGEMRDRSVRASELVDRTNWNLSYKAVSQIDICFVLSLSLVQEEEARIFTYRRIR